MILETNSYADVSMENDMDIKHTILSDGIDDLLKLGRRQATMKLIAPLKKLAYNSYR